MGFRSKAEPGVHIPRNGGRGSAARYSQPAEPRGPHAFVVDAVRPRPRRLPPICAECGEYRDHRNHADLRPLANSGSVDA